MSTENPHPTLYHPRADECPHEGVGKACSDCRDKWATPDPITLAREVLDDELGWEAKPDDPIHREDIEAVYRLANAAPALARAVTRVEALAAELVDDAEYVRNAFNGLEGRRRSEERLSAANLIRAALTGGDA